MRDKQEIACARKSHAALQELAVLLDTRVWHGRAGMRPDGTSFADYWTDDGEHEQCEYGQQREASGDEHDYMG